MRTHELGCAVTVLLCAQGALGLTLPEKPAPDPEARLEVRLDRPLVPNAAVLDWQLMIDGAPVPVESADNGWTWSGTFKPGAHTVGLRLRYSRDMKMLINLLGGRVGFTFVDGVERWVDHEAPVEMKPSTVVRVTATLRDNPEAISDRLQVDLHQEALPECTQMPCKPSGGKRPSWQGEFDVGKLVQERAAWVSRLVAPQLVREAGQGGEPRVRLSVDERGYVRDVVLERSSGSAVLDGSVEEVLRLAEPYPVFEGSLTVTLPLLPVMELAPSPLSKLPSFRRR